MKKLVWMLGAALAVSACDIIDLEDDAEEAVSAIKGAPGKEAAEAGFRATNIAVGQVNQAIGAAAGGSPGASIPSVEPETKSDGALGASPYAPQAAASTGTGFEGPVAGPDGTDGWYKQTYTWSDYANNQSSFDLYIKSDPQQDLAAAWPKLIKSLKYSWRGVSGWYDGYQWDSELTVYSENRIGGTWSFKVNEPTDANSYAKYYVGSSYSGEFDLGGAALGDEDHFSEEDLATGSRTVKVTYDYTNYSKYAIHFENRYDRGGQTALTEAVVSDWYGAWSWAATANQTITFGDNAWTTAGPFTYETLWYWGMGKDPADFTTEPAYAEDVTPPAGVWADPAADTTNGPAPGLYYWSKGSVKAEADYVSTYDFGATESTVTGTCSGGGTSLSYRGGKKCVKTVTDCENIWEGIFPVCYEGYQK